MNRLKRALVASLTEHPAADFYCKAAGISAQLAQELAQTQALGKADVLARDENGKPFMDAPAGWKNFAKIAELVRLGGENFTYDDFVSPIIPDTNKTLLSFAVTHGGMASIFTVDIWKGRFEEMEKVWFKVPNLDRRSSGGVVPLALKRELLAAEGKEVPEDRLAKAQVSHNDIRNTGPSESTFSEVNSKLQRAGDYFRKEYALLPDFAGDSMFDRRGSFARFDDIQKIMNAHGERFEVADYLKQLASAPSLLKRAAEQDALDKVFAPAQWADRLPDMLKLWSNVLDAWKKSPMTAQDFDTAYTQAEALTYAKRLKPVNGKADLLTPLNAGLNEKPVLPLGLKAVWDKFAAVKEKLAENGEALTMADLRLPSGQMGDTCLMSAVKSGHFDKVVEIANQSGQPLTVDDLVSTDGHGNTLVNILAEKGHLSQIFTLAAWTGQLGDMRKVWSHVSAANRDQINYHELESSVTQATLKMKANCTAKIRRR